MGPDPVLRWLFAFMIAASIVVAIDCVFDRAEGSEAPIALDRGEWYQFLDGTLWPRNQWDETWSLVRCESPTEWDDPGFDPDVPKVNIYAEGDNGWSLGPFMIHTPSWPWFAQYFNLRDPKLNANVAYMVYVTGDRGWDWWSCGGAVQ